MKFLLIPIILVLSACTNVSDLLPPTNNISFTLEEDMVLIDGNGKWVSGIRKGHYKAVGENKNGYYFMSNEGGLINLDKKYTKEYVELGEIKSFDRQIGEYILYGGVGGIWIPKEGVDKKPWVFKVLNANYEQAFGQGGLVNVGTAFLVNNTIVKWNSKDFSALVEELEFKTDQ